VAQLILPLDTRPALGRDDFVVAPGNREAVAFIDAFPNWPSPSAALYGPSGSGKSHLVAAWAAKSGARIIAASALDGLFEGGDAGAIAVEDVDAAAPDARREAILFALIERGSPVLLTGRETPARWPALIGDLASRYRALLAFPLWAPDDALLGALAHKLFSDRQLTVPESVIAHMIRSLERSPAAIRDFVARADAKALSEKRPITTGLVRELLAEGGGEERA